MTFMKERISEIPGGSSVEAAESVNLTRLDSMSREELIALCKRFARQCGMVAAMTKEETAQAMLDTLAHTALKPIVSGVNMKADIQSRMTAIDKWLDRERGKPMQTQVIDVKGGIEHKVMLPATRAFLDSFIEHDATIDS